MNHGLASEVDLVADGADHSNNDSQISNAAALAPFEKKFDELRTDQAELAERFNQLEMAMKNELDHFKRFVQDTDLQLRQIQQQISDAERTSPSLMTNFEQISQKIAEHDQQLQQLKSLGNGLAAQQAISPEKLREELITGIRMLGERVTKAIAEMKSQMDQFTKEIQQKISQQSSDAEGTASALDAGGNDAFAALKESKLLDANDFEIVPREAIQRLTDLFKKQSAAVKNYIQKHEERIQEFEKILKVYDEENTRLLDLLNRRIKRNLAISLLAVFIAVLWMIIRGQF